MGFWARLLGRKKGPLPVVLFEANVKKMDIRNGSFLWFLDRDSGKEFSGDHSIKKVVIDLPDQDLAKKVEAKTVDGLVKIPLKVILENLGSRHKFFKFVHLKKPVHVTVFGVLNGDVDLTFSKARPGHGTAKASADEPDEEQDEEKGSEPVESTIES